MVNNKQKGFSLIEMLVVIAIMGLLAAIAVPIYSSYRIKSNRSAGKVALVNAAQQMERYFTENNTYSGATAGTTFSSTSENGLYQISFTQNEPTATTYTIQAVAVGAQTADTNCTPLTIDQTGKKTPASCW